VAATRLSTSELGVILLALDSTGLGTPLGTCELGGLPRRFVVGDESGDNEGKEVRDLSEAATVGVEELVESDFRRRDREPFRLMGGADSDANEVRDNFRGRSPSLSSIFAARSCFYTHIKGLFYFCRSSCQLFRGNIRDL
jgi:hypothetical protein